MERKMLRGFIICLFFCAVRAQNQNGGKINFEVGGKAGESNIMTIFNKLGKPVDDSESGDGSGDTDKEIYSGSGSGEPEVEEVTTTMKAVTTKTKNTKTKNTKTTKTKATKEPKVTVEVIFETTTKAPTKKPTTTMGNEVIDLTKLSTEDVKNNVAASRAGAPADDPVDNTDDTGKETGIDFTVGIIVGVVVGAILAILVIVFLVYRLRKKDEGSYSLDEPSSQAFIRDEKNGGGQGKEYFA